MYTQDTHILHDDISKHETFEEYFTKNLYTNFMNNSEPQSIDSALPDQQLIINTSDNTTLNHVEPNEPLLQYYAFQIVKKKIKNKKTQKNFIGREGDWTCFNCKNLNFSFRKKCNRCKISKCLSDNQHETYLQSILKIIENNQLIRNQSLK